MLRFGRSVGLALSAGFCAAMASVCVKLSFSSEEMFSESLGLCNHLWTKEVFPYCQQVIFLLRILLFGLMFLFNGLMWTLFVKSMQNASSSTEAMVMNNASNFIFSALFGKIVFGEMLSLQWWLGASLIVSGLFLINKNMEKPGGDMSASKEGSSISEKKHS